MNKIHEVTVKISFNKEVTKAEAIRAAKDCIHGTDYPLIRRGDEDMDLVMKVKRVSK